jgi:mannose-6-phosphate isomerase-like protein (cupin superfamily)
MKDNVFLLRAAEARTVTPLNIFGDLLSIKIEGRDTGGRYSIFENRTEPMAGPPLHRHGREDEWFYILEGEYLFEVDGRSIPAGPGCSLFAPRGTAHTFQNVGATPGRMLVVAEPAGLDEFFIDLAAATKSAKEPDLSVVVPIFDKHGLELLGPPLATREAAVSATNSAT